MTSIFKKPWIFVLNKKQDVIVNGEMFKWLPLKSEDKSAHYYGFFQHLNKDLSLYRKERQRNKREERNTTHYQHWKPKEYTDKQLELTQHSNGSEPGINMQRLLRVGAVAAINQKMLFFCKKITFVKS